MPEPGREAPASCSALLRPLLARVILRQLTKNVPAPVPQRRAKARSGAERWWVDSWVHLAIKMWSVLDKQKKISHFFKGCLFLWNLRIMSWSLQKMVFPFAWWHHEVYSSKYKDKHGNFTIGYPWDEGEERDQQGVHRPTGGGASWVLIILL